MNIPRLISMPPIRSILATTAPALAALLVGEAVRADTPLVYVPLTQPCRLLDTRFASGGPGPLTQAHGNYQFYTDNAHVSSPAQNGSSTGCSIPAGISVVSVNFNMLNTTASGNIRAWSDDLGTTGPAPGTGVYNPSVTAPQSGQVLYNAGYSNIAVGADGGFYLAVANGQIDMTINVTGYWRPIGWGVSATGIDATALGNDSLAQGDYSIAMGAGAIAGGSYSFAAGTGFLSLGGGCLPSAVGTSSTAMGYCATAGGFASTALGAYTSADDTSIAMGETTTASGYATTALGNNANTNSHAGSFAYGDYNPNVATTNDADNQFMVRASGGFKFYTSTGMAGVSLAAGAGSWLNLSDSHAKDAVRPVDVRNVLAKVLALPLSTWRYKTQEAKYRHMGPMAQDFYAAFHLGESDIGIDTADADGVALAAIQGLYAQLTEKAMRVTARQDAIDRDVAALQTGLANQKAEIAAQGDRITSLQFLAGDLAEVKAQVAALRRSRSAMATVAMNP